MQLGNNIQPSEGAEEPLVSFTAEDPTVSGGSYTLVSFDPDAPSRVDQHFGPWRHLIRGELKPKSLDEIAVAGGGSLVERTEEPVTPWAGPSPGAGTGSVSTASRAWPSGELICGSCTGLIATSSCSTSKPSR